MTVDEVMNALQGSSATGSASESLYKAWTTQTGLVNYDLEKPAKSLYPVLTPIRNELPRTVSGMGDTATHWKAITAINSAQVPIGLEQGERGGVMNVTLVDRTATYVTYGLDNYVTYQAQWASEGFDSAVERAVQTLLEAVMIAEESMILGGNSSVALGTTPTPTATGVATGGALSNGTYYVGCVALTHDGWRLATVSATGVQQQIVRANADGTVSTINGGTATPSAQSSSVTLAAGTALQSIHANVTAVQGAVAYAWYLGNSASNLYIQQITTINSVNFTTAYTTASRQNFIGLSAADYSSLGTFSFNGFLYQTGFDSTSGGYYTALATGTDGTGTSLTSDGAAGVVEIETALQSFWDNYNLTPDTLWVSAQEARSINKLIVANNGAPLFRFNVANGSQLADGNIGGSFTASYLNKYTNGLLTIRIHPKMPRGTMLFTSKTLPYPHTDIPEVARMKLRRDYFQIQWPMRTLRYEYGVYCDGVLQVYFPAAFGVITNIAPVS